MGGDKLREDGMGQGSWEATAGFGLLSDNVGSPGRAPRRGGHVMTYILTEPHRLLLGEYAGSG